MADPDLRTNPDALAGAPPPRIGRFAVEGTSLYAEVRGSGPTVLLIHAGGEDAEVWRPVAERLHGTTVVAYDRRGTLRSGRDAWPGRGSEQHADDAASLLRALGLGEAVVFGASAGGIVALRLAVRHPGLVRRAIVYEAGLFAHAADGAAFRGPADAALIEHLRQAPEDWVGAVHAFGRALAPTSDPSKRGFLEPPPGRDWYAAREDGNAEALARDDIPILTSERFDPAELATLQTDVRFAYGSDSSPIFRQIATGLAAHSRSDVDEVAGGTHAIYHQPEIAATYLRRHAIDDRWSAERPSGATRRTC